MNHVLLSSVVCLSLVGLGCTSVLYDGPSRDPGTTAVVFSGAAVNLRKVDDRPVEDGAFTRFEVAPGSHSVEIDLSQDGSSAEAARRLRTSCFEARASRLYEVQSVVSGLRNRASVIDVNTGRKVGGPCVQAPSASTAVGSDDDLEADTSDDTDSERPRARPSAPPLGRVRVGLGYAVGGETAFELQYSNGESDTLHSGDGTTVTVALALTPYWIGDSVGLGAGASAGFKYGWLDSHGYSASISRTSVATWFQLAFRPTDVWFGELGLGAQKDFDIAVSASAGGQSASVGLKSAWGFLSEFGLYRLLSRHFGCGFVFRFVKIDYAAEGQVVAADSFGAEFTLNTLF